MSDKSPGLDEAGVSIEERKLALAERQHELDNHWSKRWAPLLIPGVLSLAGIAITVLFTNSNDFAQRQETERQAHAAAQEQQIADARAAAEMYFDKLSELRAKAIPNQDPGTQYVEQLHIVETLSNNPDIKDLLRSEEALVINVQRSQTASGGLQTAGPSQAVQGLPDLVAAAPGGKYQAPNFLAFPQVPGSNKSAEPLLLSGLKSLGFKVQPTQYMAPDASPADNQIRYYRADQKPFAKWIAQQLTQATKLDFSVVQLATPDLPNGVMEFWIGTASKE